jgi:hypothetical protein
MKLKRLTNNYYPREAIDDVPAQLEKRWGKWSWIAFVYILNDPDNLSK